MHLGLSKNGLVCTVQFPSHWYCSQAIQAHKTVVMRMGGGIYDWEQQLGDAWALRSSIGEEHGQCRLITVHGRLCG
jgi:hypothetical protein